MSNSNLTSYYTTLRNYYADSPSNYNFNLSSDRRKFVEERMKEDAKALNFSISLPFDAKNGKFVLPSNFNPSSERIIAMTTAMHFGDCEYHFYVRNGNGTCLNGHGGNCSMWSHKPSLGEITNKAFSDNNIILCDENIAEYVDDNNNSSEYTLWYSGLKVTGNTKPVITVYYMNGKTKVVVNKYVVFTTKGRK